MFSKKPSAADASEIVYKRERVKGAELQIIDSIVKTVQKLSGNIKSIILK